MKRHIFRPAVAVAVALAAVALARAEPARAQNPQDTRDLESMLDESVVTTAAATAQVASAAPATSVTITSEDLQTFGLRSLAEAIDFLGLGVATSDTLRTPDIGSRGVMLENDGGKHFLLLIDGHAINDPLYGGARFDQGAGVPIDVIDHIEVVIGPGSVLYGSNAMMGVVNVITKSASGYKGGHAVAEYEPGRSLRASVGAGVTFSLFGKPSEIVAAAEYYDQFGPDLQMPFEKFPFGDTSFSRGGAPNGLWGGPVTSAYFTQAPSGSLHFHSGDFDVAVLASSYKRGIPYSTETLSVDFDDPESFELEHALRADIKHTATLSAPLQLTSRLYGDLYGYQRQLNAVSTLACLYGHGIDTCTYHDVGRAQWGGVEERLSMNWLLDGRLVTLLGIDARLQRVQSKEDQLDFATGQPINPTAGRIDAGGSIVSPYVQQTWSPVSWLDLNGGARLDVDNRYSPVVSPRAAVTVHPDHMPTFKAIYSQAFRAPTWSETSLADYLIAPANQLGAEQVRSIEGSIEQRFARQRLFFGLFRTWWSNLIELGPLPADAQTRLQQEGRLPTFVPPGILQYSNVATVDNYGLNATFEGALAGNAFRYGLNVTEAFARSVVSGQSEPLAIAPQVFGNVHVAYALGGNLPTVAFAAYFMGPRPADRPLTLGAPIVDATALAQLRFTLTGKVPRVPGLSYRLSATVETASESAYTAGPNIAEANGGKSTFVTPPLGFAPTDPFSALIGLRYDFATGDAP
jgi:outer membrane receptor for ferrienterochelin and colicins